MKRFFSLLLSIIVIVSVFLSIAPTAFAASYSGSAGSSVSWLLDTYSGVLTFSGTGSMADYSADEQPEWNRYQGYIKSVVVESGVTSIGAYAFYNGGTGYKYNKLTSVDCSGSVTVINSYAFRGCGGLTQVINSGSVSQVKEYAFRSCKNLAVFDFSAAVTIENGAFSYCENLNNMNFSALLTTVGSSAFKGCSGVSWFTVPSGVKNLGAGAFAECTGLTSVIVNSNQIAASETSAFYGSGAESGMTAYFSSVTTVSKNLFSNCTNLTAVDLSGVTTVNEKAFANTGLVNVFIPASTATINAKAFEGCVSLQSFTVSSSNAYFSANSDGILMNRLGTQIVKYPAGRTNASYTVSSPVTTLANNAFSHANNLTSVTVSSVATISDYAFAECRNLEDINLGSAVTKVGNYSFANCDMLQNLNMNSVTSVGSFSFFGCDSLYSFTSSSALKTINTYAFSNCKSLTNVVLSEGLTTLGSYAFSHCIALVSAVIPSTVSSVSTGAFMNCDSLANATITKGVTSLGENAFLNCTAMQSITVPSTVTTINSHAIGYQYSNKYEPVQNFKIYCTAGSRAYQYASDVSAFQYEIITDSVDEISFDDTQPEENPSSLSPFENIINYITNFDVHGFVIYVFGLITELIRKLGVLY